jgi:Pyruvate/2-oxoacid:ferredoxin oxidoreductase delta subunit
VAFGQGIGRDAIEVLGERIEDVRIPHFQLPPLSGADWNLPAFIRKALKNALSTKPVIEEKKCISCNQCVEICPPQALRKKTKGFAFDYGKCIRCFCCQEVCSEGAITIKPGWALKFIGKR